MTARFLLPIDTHRAALVAAGAANGFAPCDSRMSPSSRWVAPTPTCPLPPPVQDLLPLLLVLFFGHGPGIERLLQVHQLCCPTVVVETSLRTSAPPPPQATTPSRNRLHSARMPRVLGIRVVICVLLRREDSFVDCLVKTDLTYNYFPLRLMYAPISSCSGCWTTGYMLSASFTSFTCKY